MFVLGCSVLRVELSFGVVGLKTKWKRSTVLSVVDVIRLGYAHSCQIDALCLKGSFCSATNQEMLIVFFLVSFAVPQVYGLCRA